MCLNRRFLLTMILVLSACADDGDDHSRSDISQASLPGVYAGTFPCSDCPGIPSTLWLRPDGRFFFRQHYPADDHREAMDAYSLGRWIADGADIELRGSGPRRSLTRIDPDTLDMQTDSDLEHRLIRQANAAPFSATIRLTGMMRMKGARAIFAECLAGFDVPVAKGTEFTRFRHQYRSAGVRGEAIYVELEGRFSWTADGVPRTLTIERFITAKTDGSC